MYGIYLIQCPMAQVEAQYTPNQITTGDVVGGTITVSGRLSMAQGKPCTASTQYLPACRQCTASTGKDNRFHFIGGCSKMPLGGSKLNPGEQASVIARISLHPLARVAESDIKKLNEQLPCAESVTINVYLASDR